MIGDGKYVLVVDDIETMRLVLTEVLAQEGFTVVQVGDGVQALGEMQQRHFDAVVTDDHMPCLDGLDLIRQSQMAWPEVPVILFSGIEWDTSGPPEVRQAFAWVRKSSDPGVLLSMLALAVGQGVEWKSQHAMERVGA
ncbi:MAG: response regulator [Nitrospiraceae bacterium]